MQIRSIMNIWFSLLVLSFIGCGGSSDNADSLQPDPEIKLQPTTDQDIAMRSVCMACHQIRNTTLGPSIEDISRKYKVSDIKRLAATVKAGKTFDELTWGDTPMPPSFLPEEEIQKVIKWMLTQ